MSVVTTTAKSYYQITAEQPSDVSLFTTSLSFPFDALNASDVSVIAINTSSGTRASLAEGVDFSLDFATKTVTCLLSSWDACVGFSGLTGADAVRIYRTTTTQAIVDFQSASVLSERDLDLAYQQNLFASQESTEDAAFTFAGIQSVSEGVIESGAVTESKIADGSVTESKLANDSVSTDRIQDYAVTQDKLANLSVGHDQLTANAVTTDKILDGAVTAGKLAEDAVTYDNVTPATPAQLRDQSAAGIVTPDVIKYSPIAASAWGRYQWRQTGPDTTSGGNIEGVSFNVDVATTNAHDNIDSNGDYYTGRVFFETDATTDEYTVLLSIQGGVWYADRELASFGKQVGSFGIHAQNLNPGASTYINFVVFGGNVAIG